MYKIGDRVVRIITNKERFEGYNYGDVGVVIGTFSGMDVDVEVSIQGVTGTMVWNVENCILEEIFKSPLYQALNEKE